MCLGSLLPACASSGGGDVSEAVKSYVSAWGRRDYRAMARLVDHPPKDFVSFHRAVITNLGVEHADYVAGRPEVNGDQATVPLTNHFVIQGLGAWTAQGVLQMTNRDGRCQNRSTQRCVQASDS